jgi:hypothetical protein
MVLPLIFLEDKHTIFLHLSIIYEYQQFVQHRICFSIQPPDETSHVTTHATHSDPWPTLARSTSLFLICCLNITLIHGVAVQVNIWKLCKITKQGQILLLDLFICYIVLLSFFVVKPIKPINMKSNVCNSLNYSAQYIGRHDWQ